jgi:cytochrome c556
MKGTTSVRTFTTLAVTFMLVAPLAGRAADPDEVIKYRKAVMKANGAHMAASGAIIQGKVDYKASLAGHAQALAAVNKDISALFPKDSDLGDTNALESVWKNRAEFDKRAKETQAKADAFLKAAQGGDMAAAGAKFKELSDSCKACHKDFRKEQK